MKKPTLQCVKCLKEFTKDNITRVTIEKYAPKKYAWFQPVEHIDICNRCYSRMLSAWLHKPLKGGEKNDK